MKHLKIPLVALLLLTVTSWLTATSASAYRTRSQAQSTSQAQATALERGYRTGYSDGYNSGYKDISDHTSRDYQSKDEYQRADRSYNEVWGPLEDYRDGYQQGFEAGYAAGYDRQPFNSSIPAGLRRRTTGQTPTSGNTSEDTNRDTTSDTTRNTTSEDTTRNTPPGAPAPMGGAVLIPRDAILVVELQSGLSTDASQRGDRFQARVLEPREYEGAIVEGRVTVVKRPGKVKGVAELQLSFDTIRLTDNRESNFNADVVEVVDMSGRDGVGTVDPEGGVRGKDSTKDDVSKVGATTGIGAIIGAIAGGGKGAAIGAVIGGGIGTGGVLNQRGKDIRLNRGQRLKIRTATDTRLQ
jgi:hypothetical protein